MNKFLIKILGNPNKFELRHRVSNAVILIGIFLGIQSSIFNYLLGLPEITVTATIGTSIILIFAYYLSRIKGMFEIPVYISLFISLVIYTPVMWIGNGGSSGGFQYYIFAYLTFAIAVINKKSIIIPIISFIVFLSVFLLVYEYKFPEKIFQYPSPTDRLFDITLSFVSVLIGIFSLFYIYTNLHKKTNLILESTNKELNKQKQILANQNEYINDAVTIGDQIWMAENLKYNVEGSKVYDDDPLNEEIYGRLYTWEHIMNGEEASNENPSGVQGIAPEGWHIPSRAEWDELIHFVGGQFDDNIYFNNAGNSLKEVGTEHWLIGNNGDNESGF